MGSRRERGGSLTASCDIVCYSSGVSRLSYRHRQYNSIAIIHYIYSRMLSVFYLLFGQKGWSSVQLLCVPLWLRPHFDNGAREMLPDVCLFDSKCLNLLLQLCILEGSLLSVAILVTVQFLKQIYLLALCSLSIYYLNSLMELSLCTHTAVVHTNDVKSEPLRTQGLFIFFRCLGNKFVNKTANKKCAKKPRNELYCTKVNSTTD